MGFERPINRALLTMEHYALGIDIGGTTTTFGVVSKQGEIIFEEVIKTKDYETANLLLAQIHTILSEKSLMENLLGIGIGAPNGNSKTGQIEFAPNLQWKGIVAICKIAEDIFLRPAILINDANAAAIGEKMFGAARNCENFVSITLGTGLGSGVFINNELVEGQHGFAGEFGHIRVIPQGRLCGCGRKGCLETYASSTGVVKTLNEWTVDNVSLKEKYKNYHAHDIFNAAQNGDDLCIKIVNYTAEILGNALADFACFSDPQMYVLFGGIAQSGDFFTEKVNQHMEANLLKVLENKIQIVTSQLHHQNAAVLGTAASIFWRSIKKA